MRCLIGQWIPSVLIKTKLCNIRTRLTTSIFNRISAAAAATMLTCCMYNDGQACTYYQQIFHRHPTLLQRQKEMWTPMYVKIHLVKSCCTTCINYVIILGLTKPLLNCCWGLPHDFKQKKPNDQEIKPKKNQTKIGDFCSKTTYFQQKWTKTYA